MKFEYGKTQRISSDKMRGFPVLSKVVYKIFGYTNVGNYARSRVVAKLLKKLPLVDFRQVMDLGAGLGEFTFMMAEVMPETQFVALEILPERINKLHDIVKKFNFKNIHVYGDFIQSMKEENHFDFIFSVDVFEHIPDREMPFTDCYKKLREGGYLIVKIPNVKQRTIFPSRFFVDHQQWLDDEHVGQVYDLTGLETRFKNEGFAIVYSSYSDGWLSRLAWEIGYLSKKSGSIGQLFFLPLCKALIALDPLFMGKSGNAIQVIGKKPILTS